MKMKVLHLGKYFPPYSGGVEHFTYVIAKAAVDAGHDVTVIVSNSSNKYKKEKVKGIKVIRFPRFSKILRTPFTPPIISMINDIQPDLIHMHIPNPWFELNLLFYLLLHPKTKVVVTYHSDVINYTPMHFIGNILRFLYLYPLLKFFCDKIMPTSPNYVQGSAILKSVAGKISIIPLSVDIDELKTKEKIKTEKKTLLFIGRLTPYKGLNYLLETIKLLSRTRGDFILYVIGDGDLKENLMNQVKALGIENYVKFIGEVSRKDLLRYYNTADIFVLPSIFKSEAFGIVQLEAMAFKKPVISTKIYGSGVPYVNLNGVTGLVVEPKDSKELANAINKLLDDKKLREEMGKRGRQRVKENFTQKKMTKDILNVYKEVLKGS